MDATALWQRYEDWLYYHEGLSLYLDISRVGFDDDLMDFLKPKFEQAFQEMEALEGGAIANPDETAWWATTGCAIQTWPPPS